jgi:hypothetical protein
MKDNKEISIYDLMKDWFDFCFENPEQINPNHSALYFFILSHSNRLGWKPKIGLPTTMAKEAVGIKSYNTYIKTLNELIGFGFIKLLEKSKNQWSSNIIAISKFDKALNKALDKATLKHVTKQSESTIQSTSSIIIPSTNTLIHKDTIEERKLKFASTLQPFILTYGKGMIDEFFSYWTEPNKGNSKFRQEMEKTWSLERRLETWKKNGFKFSSNKEPEIKYGQPRAQMPIS